MKKYGLNFANEEDILNRYNTKVKDLDREDLLNSSTQDKVDAFVIANAAVQISSKTLEARKEATGVASLEDVLDSMKKKLNEILSTMDAEEEFGESLIVPAQPSVNVTDVHELKAKEKTWKELKPTMTNEEFIEMVSMAPSFFLGLLIGAVPKVTSKSWVSNATTITPLIERGYLINKSEKSVAQSKVTRQLSLEDLEDLFAVETSTVAE